MTLEEDRKNPDPNCVLCEGEGSIHQSGFDDSDSYIHFGSVDCDCTKMTLDEIILQRYKEAEESPELSVSWRDIKND
jgi:hypothetical protein